MNGTISNDRILRFLQATPEQQALVDRILEGKGIPPVLSGPLLLGMGAGAKLLGVSRATFWRMIRAGRLDKVEVLPGSFRVRRADLEAVAAGKLLGVKSENSEVVGHKSGNWRQRNLQQRTSEKHNEEVAYGVH